MFGDVDLHARGGQEVQRHLAVVGVVLDQQDARAVQRRQVAQRQAGAVGAAQFARAVAARCSGQSTGARARRRCRGG
jgi:hypothetical protein